MTVNKSEDHSSVFSGFLNEWKMFIATILRPLFLATFSLTFLSLFFAYSTTDKTLYLVFSIAAAVLGGFAGGIYSNSMSNYFGNKMLRNKGDSAVRNLAVARIKINNIVHVATERKSLEEVKNLAQLLEKDIASAIQDWKDLYPAVEKTEEVYALLEARETALSILKKEFETLKEEHKKSELEKTEQTEVELKLYKMEKQIPLLKNEIERLRTVASTITTSASAATVGMGLKDFYGTPAYRGAKCKNCGRNYMPPTVGEDEGLCGSCLIEESDLCKRSLVNIK